MIGSRPAATASLGFRERLNLLAFDTAFTLANRHVPARDYHSYLRRARLFCFCRYGLRAAGLDCLWPYVLDPWLLRWALRRAWWDWQSSWESQLF